MPLTALAPKNAAPRDKPYKMTDGQGLYLFVMPSGSKLWRMNYRHHGRQKTLAIGAFPSVTLADARAARDDARRILSTGRDPSAAKQEQAAAARTAAEETFRVIAAEWLALREAEGLAEQTCYRNRHILESYAFPAFGSDPIREIRPRDILAPIRQLEARGAFDTAHRFRALVSRVFRFAIVSERADVDPAAALQDALVAQQVTHHAGLTDPRKVGGLMRAIEGYDGHPVTRYALEFMARTFPRTVEMRNAEKEEFDLKERLWRIPAAKMKMDRDHIVPLSTQTVALLEKVRDLGLTGSLVFPGVRTSHERMSDGTINAALRRLGYSSEQHVGHGFRTTASTTLNECGLFNEDWVERQLAHVDRNQVRSAYNAALYLPQRIQMMQWYSDFLDAQRDLADLLG